MKASYKLKLEQHQRRLGLTHKELNKLDRKHNDINLIKHLQSLEVTASAPAGPSGWYGMFEIYNSFNYYGTQNIDITVEADTNGTIVELNPFDTILVGGSIFFTLSEENRLTSPSTLIKVTFLVDEGGTLFGIYPGTGLTNEEALGTATELYFTVDSGYIEDTALTLEVTTTG